MSVSAFITNIEAGATHIVHVIEHDIQAGVAKIVALFHIAGQDISGAYTKFEAAAAAEIGTIRAKADADVLAVTAKVNAVKKALGL